MLDADKKMMRKSAIGKMYGFGKTSTICGGVAWQTIDKYGSHKSSLPNKVGNQKMPKGDQSYEKKNYYPLVSPRPQTVG